MHFKGNAIEVLFKILIDLCKDGVEVLAEVLNCSNVGHGDVDTGAVFAVCKNVGWEGASSFEAVIEGGSHNGAEMGLNSMHDRDWASVNTVGLGDGDTGSNFGGRWDYATNEAELNEAEVEIRKRFWEASKEVDVELLEPTGSWDGGDVMKKGIVGVGGEVGAIGVKAEGPVE